MSQSLNPTAASFQPTTAHGPKVGLVVAVLLHAAIVAVTLFSWQHQLEIADESPPVVPVDVVTIGAKTNIAPTVERHITPQPKDDVAPPPQNTPAPTPPPPQAEAAPEPVPSQPVLPKPTPVPAPMSKPQAQAPTQPDQKKPKTDDFSALLNKLTAPAATPRNARVADRTVKGIGAMNAATMDLVDALRNAMIPCWSPPVAAPDPARLVVTFDLFLNADGSVAKATSDSLDVKDPYVKAAAESARRAIYSCAPYKLPADQYNTWRDITVDFDPRKMAE